MAYTASEKLQISCHYASRTGCLFSYDISVAFLSRVERGNSHINLKRLNQLCGLLDVTEGYLLNGASNSSTNYLNKEFSELLKGCSPDTQKLIYNVAQVIAESERE